MGLDDYAQDILRLERALVTGGPPDLALGLRTMNLLSRYPREYEAIRRELGELAEVWPEEEEITQLLEERLRLAEARSAYPTLRRFSEPPGMAF